MFLALWGYFAPTALLYAQSQPAASPALTDAEKKGIMGRELIFHRKYDEAIAYFKKLEQEDPNSVLGSFGQMAVWQSRMFENYDFRFDKEFQEVSERNKALVQKILDQKDASAWELFLSGASAGLRAFYLMRRDSPFKALGESSKSHKALERALEKDPSFKDVYLGLGMYDFWRSVFTNRIKILPFFSDKRAEGLAQIEKSYREGRVVGALSAASMAFCFYEQRNAAKAIPYLQDILKSYPENVIAKNLLADFYILQARYPEAHALLDGMLKTTPEVITPKFMKGYAYYREGNYPEARRFYEDFLASHPSEAWISYALTDLGRIDLKEGKENDAYEKFKKAYRTYPDNSAPLKELNKLRGRRW